MKTPKNSQNKNRAPILFYDGMCPLCGMFVRFLRKIDKRRLFLVSPLQGHAARSQLAEEQVRSLKTVVLKDGEKQWVKSDAVLEIFRRIGPPWSLLAFFSFLPKNLRDFIYQITAKYRYNVFGIKNTSSSIKDLYKERFLE